MKTEIDELNSRIEFLEEENASLKEELENQEALVTALDDIQHYLDSIRDVFYDLNKKDIYRNNF
nr:MAG TPA: delta-sleep-inducing peptide [Caudoviricetes sp.]DAT07216.1 MAG TPA: delta-sleep-inducing peptide [Caudoviricetes sp.]